MSNIRRPTWDKPKPETYVRSALRTVGLQSRTFGYWAHALLAWMTTSLPVCLSVKLAMHMNKGIRSRYLKKAKRN